jgi:hypothetical protein
LFCLISSAQLLALQTSKLFEFTLLYFTPHPLFL